MQQRLKSRLYVCALVGMCLTSTWCNAQSHREPQTAEELSVLSLQELGKIKITAASLFQNNELHTAASVTIIQEQDWHRNGARSLTDAFQHVASVYSIPIVFAANGISIRGLPLNGGTGVLVTLDGVPIPEFTTGNTFQRLSGLNLGALDLIQLVRGPGSALHGSDAFHGVIGMRSFQATSDIATIDAFAASNGYYQTTARYGNRLGSVGRLSIAAAANGQPEQNIDYSFVDPTSGAMLSGERDNRFDAQTVSINLDSDGDSSWSYTAGVFGHRYDADGFNGFGTSASGERDISDTLAQFFMVRAGIGKRIATQGLLSIGAYYWDLDTESQRFAKAAGVFTQRLSTLEQHRSGIRVGYSGRWGDHTRLALDLRVSEQAVDGAKLITLTDSGALVSSIDQLYADARRTTHSAVFEGNTEFASGRFDLTYGARFDSYSDADDHFSPRLGLIYHPRPDSALKLLYGHAFRAPAAVEIFGVPGSLQGDASLMAETFDTVELAWLQQSENWRLQASLFLSEWQDGIANISNPAPPPTLQATNLGTTRAKGVEVEHQTRLGAWSTRLDAVYVWNKSDVTGSFTTIPKFVATLGLGYRIAALRTDLFLDQRIQSAVDDVVRGGSTVPTRLPRYWRVDARIGTQLTTRTKVWLKARNLFDRRNVTPSSPPAQFGVENDALSVGLGVGYEF